MKLAMSSACLYVLFSAQCLHGQVQESHGPCSPNISNVTGKVTLIFTGAACGNIDPRDLEKISQFFTDYPFFQKEVLRELSRRDSSIRLLVKQMADLAAETRAKNEEISKRLAKVEILAKGPPLVQRVLQANEEDRQAAAKTIGEIEGLLQKAGFGLTPRNLTALGWLYEFNGQPEKAAASFLGAKDADQSLAANVYLGLAVSYQLQGNLLLRRGEVDEAETILAKAADNARLLQPYEPVESSEALSQLGYIQKDLADTYTVENKKAKAAAALNTAATLFQQVLVANPNDPGAHNGLGNVYSARGDTELAIAEYENATKLEPEYTFAWHDLTLALYAKYMAAPNMDTLRKLALALKTTIELQTSPKPMVQRLPPAAFAGLISIKDFVVAEADKLKAGSARAGEPFAVSGAATLTQTYAIQTALTQYREYLAGIAPLREGMVRVQIVPEEKMYAGAISYYDPSQEAILVNVKHADIVFWPLRDFTVRALLPDGGAPLQPALVAILSGLATYYPSSFKNDPDFGPAYGGQLDNFRSLSELRLESASAGGSSIWGSICWELRTMLGASNSDRLLFEAWKQMDAASQPDSYARNFAVKIIELHRASGGAGSDSIRALFERRGLKL